VIDEDMVSRRHAKITTFYDGVMLHDLNSTNGTSVNQQKIQGAQRLQAGDFITIGTCILELMTHAQAYQDSANPPATYNQTEPQPVSAHQSAYSSFNTPNPVQPSHLTPPNTPAPSMHTNSLTNTTMGHHANPPVNQTTPDYTFNQGNPSAHRSFQSGNPNAYNATPFNSMNSVRPRSKIETGTFPSSDVPDVFVLIERLIERRHDGVLTVFDSDEREGSIYFRGGHIYFVTFEDPHRLTDHVLHPIEAIMKICTWRQGRFKIKNLSALPSFENEISEDSRSLIMHVRQNCKELENLRASLPPFDTVLYYPTPFQAPLSALNTEQLDTFQLCMNQMNIGTAIDYHPKGERDGIQTVLFLMESGYLVMR
jgi:pSer/pThr/pTyr-binding forkhead associated (FHA) protein